MSSSSTESEAALEGDEEDEAEEGEPAAGEDESHMLIADATAKQPKSPSRTASGTAPATRAVAKDVVAATPAKGTATSKSTREVGGGKDGGEGEGEGGEAASPGQSLSSSVAVLLLLKLVLLFSIGTAEGSGRAL